MTYPKAQRTSHSTNYHGLNVPDPYRWLEDPTDEATQTFVASQSAFTETYLGTMPARDAVHKRLSQLLDYERKSGMRRVGEAYFYWFNDGLSNQPKLIGTNDLSAAGEVVLDPNLLSDDGTTAVTGIAFNEDASLLAYTVTEGGSDWQHLRVRNLKTGADLPDTLDYCRFPQIVWAPDNSGFYYNGHLPTDDLTSAEKNKHNKLFWHQLGTSQTDDPIIFERIDQPEWNLPPTTSSDGAYLLSHIWHGAVNRNRVYYRPITETGPLLPLIEGADADFRYICNQGKLFYFYTDLHAPNYRIVRIDIEAPQRENWVEIVPESEHALTNATFVAGEMVLIYTQNAHHALTRVSLSGAKHGEIKLPSIGSVIGISGKGDHSELFLDFYSFLYPTTSLRYDFQSDRLDIVHQPSVDFDTDLYTTRLEYAVSADGTQVPLFLTYRSDIVLDGTNPTILYGYGGFSINMSPRFSASRLQWLEMGGVFAQAVLRGGAEFGEAWHADGMLDRKQNVFDDFIASAELLLKRSYCRPETLAIQGGSNGGLLVAACMLQRPELFGAVLCHVPVIDMLRYHRFTAGRYWVPEYGDPDNPDHFDFMHAYSPLHNVKSDVEYPATLILTADKDDRVVPMHAHKFAATLQHAYPDGNPILLRFEFKAGHGFGKSVSKLINEATDVHTFLIHTLSAEFKLP